MRARELRDFRRRVRALEAKGSTPDPHAKVPHVPTAEEREREAREIERQTNEIMRRFGGGGS